VLLTAGALASVQGDEPRDCAGATDRVAAANAAHQDGLTLLDRALVRARRDGAQEARVPAARARSEQTEAELDAARADLVVLCHYPHAGAPAPVAPRREG
jgi:hypothetical protein